MFTDEEIQAVTAQLLPTGVPRGYTALGTRKTGLALDKVQQAAAGVLLLYPNSPYYLAGLLSADIVGTARSLGEQFASALSSVDALRRRTVPVSDISNISNAKTALIELETVLGSDGVTNVTTTPAFQRFDSNVNKFLRKVASNVRQKNRVVQTPAEARGSLPDAVSRILEGLRLLKEKVEYLHDAQKNYHSVDLARRVSQQVVQNARALLANRESELASMSPEDRLRVLKATVLDLLAAKGVVKSFGSFPAPSMGVEVFGQGGPFADATRSAEGGSLRCARGPYWLARGNDEGSSANRLHLCTGPAATRVMGVPCTISGNTVTRSSGSFVSDGVTVGDRVFVRSGPSNGKVARIATVSAMSFTYSGAPFSSGAATVDVVRAPQLDLYLPPAPFPPLTGFTTGSVTIVAGVNDALRLIVNSLPPTVVTFTPGVQSTDALAADIATALTGTPFTASTYFSPVLYEGPVTVAGNDLSLAYGNFPVFQIGDYVRFVSGANAGENRQITALTPSPTNCAVVTVNGAPLVSSYYDQVQIGRNKAVHVYPTDPRASCIADDRISLEPATPAQQAAGVLLGMPGSMLARSSPVPARMLSDFITANNALVSASVEYEVVSTGHRVRTDPTNARRVVVVRESGTASVPAGTSVTLTLSDRSKESEPVSGDRIVLRSGPSIGATGTVTSSTASTLNVTFDTPVVAGTANYEVGSAFGGQVVRGTALQVYTGPSNGVYLISDLTPGVPFEFLLLNPLPVNRSFSEPLVIDAKLAHERIILRSRAKTLPASLSMFDPTSTFSGSVYPPPAYGTTGYFRVPELHPSLNEGDYLDLYTNGDTVRPSFSSKITNVSADKIITLEDSVSEAVTTYTFSGGNVAPTPSAVLRNARTANFHTLQQQLSEWLKVPAVANLDLYRAEVSRNLNVAVRSTNPTQLECGDLENALSLAYRSLTEVGAGMFGAPVASSIEHIASNYVVDREVEVDTLLRTYADQGADRAYDLLLNCRFTEFFGASHEELSYGGKLQKSIRDIAIDDLPVDKFNRSNATSSDLYQSTPSPDYEFDFSDSENIGQIDPPE